MVVQQPKAFNFSMNPFTHDKTWINELSRTFSNYKKTRFFTVPGPTSNRYPRASWPTSTCTWRETSRWPPTTFAAFPSTSASAISSTRATSRSSRCTPSPTVSWSACGGRRSGNDHQPICYSQDCTNQSDLTLVKGLKYGLFCLWYLEMVLKMLWLFVLTA